MATDITIQMQDRPGQLAVLGEALGKAGINIEGVCGVAAGGSGTVHILVEDAARAREALDAAGIPVAGEQEALVLDVEDRPGALGEVSRKLADAGVNMQVAYMATGTRLVVATGDLEKARSAV